MPWPPAALRIVQYDSSGGFFLFYLDREGVELTDTWHETLERAKRQAHFEFGVSPDEWPDEEPLPPPDAEVWPRACCS